MAEVRVSLGSLRLEDTILIISVLSAPDTMKTTFSFSVSSSKVRPHHPPDQFRQIRKMIVLAVAIARGHTGRPRATVQQGSPSYLPKYTQLV